MSIISYAQNFEDVMLWRMLKHVEQGFYIDVGANDPTLDSVTRLFYEHGWRGINIEPLTAHYSDLQRERPRDINLCCAAGTESGEINLWECNVRGWATADKAVVQQHINSGETGDWHRVPVLKLSDICNQYVNGEIHFLKVDVEGFERSVIEGADFCRFQPWVVVIEATRPNSANQVYEQWEGLLTSANYQFAYADGLNRFYVAEVHSELISELKYPPNVFDEFVPLAQIQAEIREEQAKAKVEELQEILKDIYNSRSWRITRPLRWMVEKLKAMQGKV